MKRTIYTLGKYSFDPEEPFKSVDEAVVFIQERHPEVSREAIESRLKPKIKDHEPDKSGNVSETTGKSGKDVAKPGKGGDK